MVIDDAVVVYQVNKNRTEETRSTLGQDFSFFQAAHGH